MENSEMKTDQVVVQNTTTATAAFNIDTIRFAPQSDDLIHKHFARGHYEQCMALIDQPGHHQTSTTAQYYRSLVLKQEGKLAEAQTCLQQLIKTSPNNLLYLKEMARILLLQSKHKLAIAVLNEVLKKSEAKPDWEAHHLKGICFKITGQKPEALKCFRDALVVQRHPETYKEIMLLSEALGNKDDATAAVLEGLEQSPHDIQLNIKLAQLKLKSGAEPQSLDIFAKTLIKQSGNQRALLGVGNLLQRNNEFQAAINKYSIPMNIKPAVSVTPEVWSNLGLSFFGLGNMTSAITCLEHARSMSPFNWAIAFNTGLVHLASDNSSSAHLHLWAARKLNSEKNVIAGWLAVTCSKLAKFEDAQNLFGEYISKCADTDDPVISVNYCIHLAKSGRKAESIQNARQLSQRDHIRNNQLFQTCLAALT